eukprot:g28278.t1
MFSEIIRMSSVTRHEPEAICGIYRIQANSLNGRPVYKKDRSDAYLLYTTLRDWMFSGRPDAGGQRCEGWAYVTDSAEFPDEVCSVWKVSGSKGWEEDPTLVVSCYEGLPAEFKEKDTAGFEGSSVVTQKVCYDDGLLCIPVNKPEWPRFVVPWPSHARHAAKVRSDLHHAEGLQILENAIAESVKVDVIAISILLAVAQKAAEISLYSSFISPDCHRTGRPQRSCGLSRRLPADIVTYNTVTSACETWPLAAKLLATATKASHGLRCTVIGHNAVIAASRESGAWREAMDRFTWMQLQGLRSSSVTLNSLGYDI